MNAGLVSERGDRYPHVLGDCAEGDQTENLAVKRSAYIGVIAEEKNALAGELKPEAMAIICRRREHGGLRDV